MTRLTWLIPALALALGCGGDDDNGSNDPDAGSDLENPGFDTPAEPTIAYSDGSEVGPADWSCLNTPSDDAPTEDPIALTGQVLDFQTGEAVGGAVISAYDDLNFSGPEDGMDVADGSGAYSLTLPMGGVRWAFKVEADGTLDTYLLNQFFEPDDDEQSLDVDSVSVDTANALPAIVGTTRTPGLGVLAAAVRDCNGNEVGGAIATVSSTSGQADHLSGAVTYYFESGLPTRHSQRLVTNTDGLFVVIELPVTQEAHLQVWGYLDQAALDADELTLLSEIAAPILADSVVTASMVPVRQ